MVLGLCPNVVTNVNLRTLLLVPEVHILDSDMAGVHVGQ